MKQIKNTLEPNAFLTDGKIFQNAFRVLNLRFNFELINYSIFHLNEENEVVPSCSLRHIGTVEALRKNNIVLTDLKCANSTISSNCAVGSSHLTYECRKGYRFANNQESSTFKSICTKDGWTRVPDCLNGIHFY